MTEHDEIMKQMSEAFSKHMSNILLDGDSGISTTVHAQPQEPLTMATLTKALAMLRSNNPYEQYRETHEWHFPLCHREKLMEALRPAEGTLLDHGGMIGQLYGIPIFWDATLTDTCELRPSAIRLARLAKRLEMERELEELNARDDLTQEEFNHAYAAIMKRYEDGSQ